MIGDESYHARQQEKLETAKVIISELIEIIKLYHEHEVCDHSVGICYCAEYDSLDRAEKFIGDKSKQDTEMTNAEKYHDANIRG